MHTILIRSNNHNHRSVMLVARQFRLPRWTDAVERERNKNISVGAMSANFNYCRSGKYLMNLRIGDNCNCMCIQPPTTTTMIGTEYCGRWMRVSISGRTNQLEICSVFVCASVRDFHPPAAAAAATKSRTNWSRHAEIIYIWIFVHWTRFDVVFLVSIICPHIGLLFRLLPNRVRYCVA